MAPLSWTILALSNPRFNAKVLDASYELYILHKVYIRKVPLISTMKLSAHILVYVLSNDSFALPSYIYKESFSIVCCKSYCYIPYEGSKFLVLMLVQKWSNNFREERELYPKPLIFRALYLYFVEALFSLTRDNYLDQPDTESEKTPHLFLGLLTPFSYIQKVSSRIWLWHFMKHLSCPCYKFLLTVRLQVPS